MPRSALVAFAVALLAGSAASQTTTLTGGALADSSIGFPIGDYRVVSNLGEVHAVSVAGWTISFLHERRAAPAKRVTASIAITPYAANLSDHAYVDGERVDDLTFRNSEIRMLLGRADVISERWSTETRIIALYERLQDVDQRTADFWRYPYGGAGARVTWSRISAENPLLMTFRGSDVSANAEMFGGRSVWGRIEIAQRACGRFGIVDLGEHLEVLAGSKLDNVSAFLVGGSWPVTGIHTLYGYRYGEFRTDRAVTATGDARVPVRDRLAVGAHCSFMRSRDDTAPGAAIDLTTSWRGIGIRGGVAVPLGNRDREIIGYVSVVAARFLNSH